MVSNLLAGYAFDTAENVVPWLTVGVVGALVLAGVIIFLVDRFKKTGIFANYVKYGVLAFVGYALVMGILMLALQLGKRTDPAYLEDKYLNADVISFVLVPLLVVFAFVLASGIALVLVSKYKPAIFKKLTVILGSLSLAGVIAAGVTIGVYFVRHIKDGYYDSEGASVNQIALYVSAAALIVAVIAAALILGRKDKKGFDSRCIALAGICVAMSFVLSYVKLWSMPQGGSVTFVSMLPVMLFAYVYGTKKGVLVGFIYGLMQAMQDPYIIHPAQFLLDYPIAFAMVGFAGVFSSVKALKFPQVKFALGAITGGALRFLSHVLSGVFAFSVNAVSEGKEVWAYSLAYNSFVFIDIALVVVAGVLILSSNSFVRQVERYAFAADKKPAQEAATGENVQEAAASEQPQEEE